MTRSILLAGIQGGGDAPPGQEACRKGLVYTFNWRIFAFRGQRASDTPSCSSQVKNEEEESAKERSIRLKQMMSHFEREYRAVVMIQVRAWAWGSSPPNGGGMHRTPLQRAVRRWLVRHAERKRQAEDLRRRIAELDEQERIRREEEERLKNRRAGRRDMALTFDMKQLDEGLSSWLAESGIPIRGSATRPSTAAKKGKSPTPTPLASSSHPLASTEPLSSVSSSKSNSKPQPIQDRLSLDDDHRSARPSSPPRLSDALGLTVRCRPSSNGGKYSGDAELGLEDDWTCLQSAIDAEGGLPGSAWGPNGSSRYLMRLVTTDGGSSAVNRQANKRMVSAWFSTAGL